MPWSQAAHDAFGLSPYRKHRPAAFTHRGNRPKGGDKFIATSWILFQRAEVLFGAK